MTRRGNGEGAIHRDGNRWAGQLDLGHGPDGRRIRRKVRGRTKSDVAEKLRMARQQAENRPTGGRTDVSTDEDLLTRCQETVAAARLGERTTLETYRSQIDQHMVPALGHIRLDRLTPEHLDDYFRTKAEAGYSRATLVKHRSVLGQAVRWGVKRRHFGWDVVALAASAS